MTRLLLLFILFVPFILKSQDTKVYTSDIDHFWTAFDSVQTTRDTTLQLAFIQQLYMDKSSNGLKNFAASRGHSARRHLKNITAFPKFWQSIRPNTLAISLSKDNINKIIDRFKDNYDEFRQPEIYFMIGGLNSGGTTNAERLLIGSEIAAANAKTDASELSPWLQNTFKHLNGIEYLVAHEMVHTQQKPEVSSKFLLGKCIEEGSADFIAEILLEKQTLTPYIEYGLKNEQTLWHQFEQEMYGKDMQNWLYNGDDAPDGVADLGYFMGYTITKSYYENSVDKRQALKEIVQLDYTSMEVCKAFLQKSQYARKW